MELIQTLQRLQLPDITREEFPTKPYVWMDWKKYRESEPRLVLPERLIGLPRRQSLIASNRHKLYGSPKPYWRYRLLTLSDNALVVVQIAGNKDEVVGVYVVEFKDQRPSLILDKQTSQTRLEAEVALRMLMGGSDAEVGFNSLGYFTTVSPFRALRSKSYSFDEDALGKRFAGAVISSGREVAGGRLLSDYDYNPTAHHYGSAPAPGSSTGSSAGGFASRMWFTTQESVAVQGSNVPPLHSEGVDSEWIDWEVYVRGRV